MAVMGVKKAMAFSTSLALILPRSVDSGFWYIFLSKIDFFNVWSLILLVLGGSVAMQKDGKKLALYIFGIWLVFIVLTALLGAKSGAAAM
jgi:asparagine N-glycosylation enzyme membrane subunit Stt3